MLPDDPPGNGVTFRGQIELAARAIDVAVSNESIDHLRDRGRRLPEPLCNAGLNDRHSFLGQGFDGLEVLLHGRVVLNRDGIGARQGRLRHGRAAIVEKPSRTTSWTREYRPQGWAGRAALTEKAGSRAEDLCTGKMRARRTVQQFLEELHTFDHPGPGTGEVRIGIDGDDPPEARRLGRARRPGACATAPSRSNPHGMKTVMSTSAARISSQVSRRDRAPATARTGTPPAASTWSGTQCPALNGGSCHSRTSTRGRRRPRTRSRTASTRARKPSMSASALALVPVTAPTVPMHSITSSSRPGSSETTWAWHPITSSASSTAPDGTAQTWQRSCARIRSGSMARIRVSSSV